MIPAAVDEYSVRVLFDNHVCLEFLPGTACVCAACLDGAHCCWIRRFGDPLSGSTGPAFIWLDLWNVGWAKESLGRLGNEFWDMY